jgi:large subunit ribosomal protein L6
MSRIGKVPVPVPAGVTVEVSGGTVQVRGAKGTLSRPIPAGVTVEVG